MIIYIAENQRALDPITRPAQRIRLQSDIEFEIGVTSQTGNIRIDLTGYLRDSAPKFDLARRRGALVQFSDLNRNDHRRAVVDGELVAAQVLLYRTTCLMPNLAVDALKVATLDLYAVRWERDLDAAMGVILATDEGVVGKTEPTLRFPPKLDALREAIGNSNG